MGFGNLFGDIWRKFKNTHYKLTDKWQHVRQVSWIYINLFTLLRYIELEMFNEYLY